MDDGFAGVQVVGLTSFERQPLCSCAVTLDPSPSPVQDCTRARLSSTVEQDVERNEMHVSLLQKIAAAEASQVRVSDSE